MACPPRSPHTGDDDPGESGAPNTQEKDGDHAIAGTGRTRHTRKVTIRDVAEAAGVAPSTVSGTFSRPGRVSSATAQRILTIANDLGYRIDNVAPFRTEESLSALIGIVVPVRHRYLKACGDQTAHSAEPFHPGHPLGSRRRLGRSSAGRGLSGLVRTSDDHLYQRARILLAGGNAVADADRCLLLDGSETTSHPVGVSDLRRRVPVRGSLSVLSDDGSDRLQRHARHRLHRGPARLRHIHARTGFGRGDRRHSVQLTGHARIDDHTASPQAGRCEGGRGALRAAASPPRGEPQTGDAAVAIHPEGLNRFAPQTIVHQ